jgi:heme/copper-type cytochrome/quinol oxidase subunit 2
MGPHGGHDNTLNFYSGIASFLALGVLTLLGWYHYAYRKTKQNVPTKKKHKIAALVFGILALIHIYII